MLRAQILLLNNVAKTPDDLIKVTAAPRWNLQKTRPRATSRIVDPDDANKRGWVYEYRFVVETDEVAGTTESGLNPALGNEQLAGGTSTTITFTDDLVQHTTNSKLYSGAYLDAAYGGNPCSIRQRTTTADPYPVLDYNATSAGNDRTFYP